MHGSAWSARVYVGFVEVWDWGSVLSGNVSAVSLNFLLMFLVLVCEVLDGYHLGLVILCLRQQVL